jgi:Flp pilus assembly protein TadG
VTRKWRRTERGAAAVEFALVTPILLLLLFAIIIYGTLFAQDLSLSNSARQAARSGVVASATCSGIKQTAQDNAGTIGMSGDDTTVTIALGTDEDNTSPVCTSSADDAKQPCKASPANSNVYVTLDHTVDRILPFVPTPDTITGKGVFRCEFS